MERSEQKRIVEEIVTSLGKSLGAMLDAGQVPGNWDGFMVREWVADNIREALARQ